MKPFRKHGAIAIDGGGMCELIVTRALAVLESALDLPCRDIFQLAAGTSSRSISAHRPGYLYQSHPTPLRYSR